MDRPGFHGTSPEMASNGALAIPAGLGVRSELGDAHLQLSRIGVASSSQGDRGTSASVSPGPAARSGAAGPKAGVLMAAVRRELDQTDARLLSEIRRVRDGAASAAELEKSERLHEVALARMEKKLLEHEGALAKLDRKYSEVVGTLRGLQDETQQQIRKSETMDTRVWELRHQLEEELRQKVLDLETSQQEILSTCRVMAADAADPQRRLGQRLKHLEAAVQNLVAESELTSHTFGTFQDRLEAAEVAVAGQREAARQRDDTRTGARDSEIAEASSRESHAAASAKIWNLEQLISDLANRFEQQDAEGLAAKLQELEIGLRGVRSKLEIHDEHYASFDERIRNDWDAKLNKLHQAVQDLRAKHQGLHERHEALIRCSRGWEGAALSDEWGSHPASQQALGQLEDPTINLPTSKADPGTVGSNVSPAGAAMINLSGRVARLESGMLELEASNSTLKLDVDELKKGTRGLGAGRGGGAALAMQGAEMDIADLFHRVGDSESQCSRLQQQLQKRIQTMDTLLQTVEGDGPGQNALRR